MNIFRGDLVEKNYLICQYLDFIKDGHLEIDGYRPMDKNRKVYCYNEEYEFYKDEIGYYTIIDNGKYYLKSIQNSNNFNDYIKLKNDKKELNKEVFLVKTKPINRDNKIGFSKNIIKGIPVVTCTRMIDYGDNDATCRQFVESGSDLMKYPVSIIDIRGNLGGTGQVSTEWFEGYTGGRAFYLEKDAILYSKVNITEFTRELKERLKNEKDMSGQNYLTTLNAYDKMSDKIKNKEFNKWEVSSQDTNLILDNNIIIFVLIDQNDASAAEEYIEKLRTLKNVIFVGTNTNGSFLLGCEETYKLPNSGEVLYFGSELSLMQNFEEGIGFMPDIWVNSNDALERVEKLIKKSKIKK